MKSSIERADERFAVAIKGRREELDMTQAEVARAVTQLGYPVRGSTVYKIEAGLRKATVGEARAIAAALESDLQELLGVASPGIIHARAIGRAAAGVLEALATLDAAIENLGARQDELRSWISAASPLADRVDVGERYLVLARQSLGIGGLNRWRRTVLGDESLRVLISEAGISVGGIDG